MFNRRKISTAFSLKSGFYTCSLLLLLLGPVSDVAAQTTLRVGIIGDQSSTTNLQQSYQVLTKGVQILAKENISCALHTGDLLESSVAPADFRAQFAQATGILDKLGRPWHLTPGDHDVNPPPPFVPDSKDRSREELYRELYRQREPRLTPTLNHSFDVNGYHFIALNSQEHLNTDPRWGVVFLNRISPQQFDWLKHDLAKHRNARGIIVFIHQPMWYYWSNWKPVHELLRQYPVIAVIGGHFHYDQDEGKLDNIRYVVVGATGGIIKDGSRDAGHVQHVTVMTITGREVDFRLIPVEGSSPLQLTPRIDMDRVQAMASMLDGLFEFGTQNSICVKGNQIFSNKTEPARISLVPVGNPIELVTTVTLELQGNKLLLLSPHFVTGACEEVTASGACLLAPGARVAISNTSSVDLQSRFAPLPPLWESGLGIASGSTVVVGDPVSLKVRMSFQGSQGEFFVEGVATTTLTACP